ncbi:hypothetical protein SAMN03159341_12059 [Paenibacillus sp. 1_12]|uniref:hypothetical protein n=1 Tax=Paenibacillus sp. 1_12 TaxID=1566278 RepID=UPI0008F3DBB6|nr:hypothetical protein [Paenibacillus sp. 1_12]SFM20572.1 hypothetical protein SAMN03159341_12059 [Paenibacillus sp. 1_12]
MLTFEEKIAIMESFSELTRSDVSLGRVNFSYEQSAYDKKNVAYHLHPNGNGFIYAGRLRGYSTDDKGFVNIREYEADALRSLVAESILSLTDASPKKPLPRTESTQKERWEGPDNQTLIVTFEDELWYVYAGINLESAFETYEEAAQYCREEGFSKAT